MNEQIEAAAGAEAERRYALDKHVGHGPSIRAFVAGVAWMAAQPRTVSAEEYKAIVKACEPWTTFTAEDGHPSSTTLTAETIAARVLEAAGLTVAEAGEVR
jgi:hypothetical protein